MKRFTGTEKWDKGWFRQLTPKLKCLWAYLCEKADCAGIWEPDFDLAAFQIGDKISEVDLSAFGDRVERLENGKFILTGFVEFQYGTLSKECKAHIPVLRSLEKNRVSKGYPKGIHTLQEKDKDTEKEKDIGGDARGGGGIEEQVTALHLSYQASTGEDKLTLSPDRKKSWSSFIARGFTDEDMKRVIHFIRKGMNDGGKYDERSLRFGCLIGELDKFEERLVMAKKAPLTPSSKPLKSAAQNYVLADGTSPYAVNGAK